MVVELEGLVKDDVVQLDLYLGQINQIARMTKSELSKKLKALKTANPARKTVIEKLREQLLGSVAEKLKLPDDLVPVTRTRIDDVIHDVFHLTVAYVNSALNEESTPIVDSTKNFTVAIGNLYVRMSEISKAEEQDVKVLLAIVLDAIQAIGVINEQNVELKKELGKLKARLHKSETQELTLKGDVEALKSKVNEVSKFKYSNVKIAAGSDETPCKKRKTNDNENGVFVVPDLPAMSKKPNLDFGQTVIPNVWASQPKSTENQPAAKRLFCVSGEVNNAAARGSNLASELVDDGEGYVTINKKGRKEKVDKNGQPTKKAVSKDCQGTGKRQTYNQAAAKTEVKKAQRKPLTVGKGPNDKSSAAFAAPRYFSFCTKYWSTTCSADDAKKYIEEKIGPVHEIKQVNTTTRWHTFMFSVEDLYTGKVKDSANWPRNIQVSKWWGNKQADKGGKMTDGVSKASSAELGQEKKRDEQPSTEMETSSEENSSNVSQIIQPVV